MIIGGVAIACVFALAFGWLVMLLWNWLMPMLFGLKAITYWQAFGILLLSKVLFSGMGHGRRGPLRHPLFMHNSHPGWRRHLHDDWVPAGDPRNWVYYREYWNDRGKKDFEEYLNEKGRTPDRGKEGAGDQSQ
jgi:hypothetical protein